MVLFGFVPVFLLTVLLWFGVAFDARVHYEVGRCDLYLCVGLKRSVVCWN